MRDRDEKKLEEAGRMIDYALYGNHLGILEQEMVRRLERVGMLNASELLVDNQEPLFWRLVMVGLKQPEVCDQIREKQCRIMSDIRFSNITSQELVDRLTRLYDDAIANMESLAALERNFLHVSIGTGLCFIRVDKKSEAITRSLTEVFQRLQEHEINEICPSKSLVQSIAASVSEDYEHAQSVLNAIKRGNELTFWEMAAAGMGIPGEEPEFLANILLQAEKESYKGDISSETEQQLNYANRKSITIAEDLRCAAMIFQELAQEIRAVATERGLSIGAHIRTEPWRRMSPHIRQDEGMRP